MDLAVAFIGVVAAMGGVAGVQIGYLWSFEELTSKADLVVIAEPGGTDDTGRRTEHLDYKPALPVVELATRFKVVALLKADTRATSVDTSGVRLKHYRIDWDEWRRRNPPQPGLPPPGLVNAGSVLDFTQDAGPYLLFLKRGPGDVYEPLSGHTFPTDSVFLLRKVGKGAAHFLEWRRDASASFALGPGGPCSSHNVWWRKQIPSALPGADGDKLHRCSTAEATGRR